MSVKFRSEAPFGEGYRNAVQVMAYEVHALGNVDILDYLYENYLNGDLRDKAYDYADELSNNGFIDDMSLEDVQEFFRNYLTQVRKKTGKDIRYVLWLADEDAVREFYCRGMKPDEYEVDTYDISNAIVLSDIGSDGKLYGYEKEPGKFKVLMKK